MNPSWSFEEQARKAGQAGRAWLEPAVVSRALLAVNHVLMSEPQAVQRLRVHAGRRLQVHGLGGPTWLPALPDLHLEITPAGLLEWVPAQDKDTAGREFTLQVSMDEVLAALGQSRALTHAVQLEGDAALASDLAWMLEHLRWDFEADLALWMPPALAHGVARAARTGLGLLGQLGAALRRVAPAADASPPPKEGGPSAGSGPW